MIAPFAAVGFTRSVAASATDAPPGMFANPALFLIVQVSSFCASSQVAPWGAVTSNRVASTGTDTVTLLAFSAVGTVTITCSVTVSPGCAGVVAGASGVSLVSTCKVGYFTGMFSELLSCCAAFCAFARAWLTTTVPVGRFGPIAASKVTVVV